MLQHYIDDVTVQLMGSLPNIEARSPEEQRRMIARYALVLEGNFIAWMTAAYLAASTEAAREIIRENLREELRDNHPGMLRRFTQAAQVAPTETDYAAISPSLAGVREFVAQLSAVKLLVMMTFFENVIAHLMPYLAELAKRQGSNEFEYTDVHGEIDVRHTQGLLTAIQAELDDANAAISAKEELSEGVEVLKALLRVIFS